MEARLQAPWALLGLVLPLALAAVYLYAAYARRRASEVFAHPRLWAGLARSVDPYRRGIGAALALAAAVLIVISLSRPVWNPRTQTVSHVGRDVVFVADVSRSMLAEDLKPSRLARARFAILDTLDDLEGDRVALVAFAGRAVLRCPLTHDYGFFRMMTESLSPQDAQPGGTRIGDAIGLVLDDVFQDPERRYKDIVLITDGEDHQSQALAAAQRAGQAGVRLITIGLGRDDTGERIPVTDERGNRTWLVYEGKPVLTRLDADLLRALSAATPGGRYFHVSTGTVDLGEIYRNVIRVEDRTRLESETVVRYDEQYQLLLLPALVLLCAELALGQRKRNARKPG
jgi:Ca-activated chloride channel family protein